MSKGEGSPVSNHHLVGFEFRNLLPFGIASSAEEGRR